MSTPFISPITVDNTTKVIKENGIDFFIDGATNRDALINFLIAPPGATIQVFNFDGSIERVSGDQLEDGDFVRVTAEDGTTTENFSIEFEDGV